MFAPVCDVSHDLTSAITLTPARAALCRAICLLVPVAACAAGVVVAAALSSWLLPMLCMVSTAVVVRTARRASICLTRARSTILRAQPSAARSRLLATNLLPSSSLPHSPASLHRRSAASLPTSRWSTYQSRVDLADEPCHIAGHSSLSQRHDPGARVGRTSAHHRTCAPRSTLCTLHAHSRFPR